MAWRFDLNRLRRLSMNTIELQAVRVHNLKNIDLSLPLHQLIVITGVSGSGKSSLAFDTLYAEGQRRYIESFSAYARQFLDRLEKPDADRIERIPPAIAIRQNSINLSSRSTVATTTEIHDYLRLLYAKVGRIICSSCQRPILGDSPEAVMDVIRTFEPGARFQVGFAATLANDQLAKELISLLRDDGFQRGVLEAGHVDLSDESLPPRIGTAPLWVIVDRLVAGKADEQRIVDSVEQAFASGEDRCVVFREIGTIDDQTQFSGAIRIDERLWNLHRYNRRLVCDECSIEYPPPEPRLFSFNTPLGACQECEGFGSVPRISFEKVVPDPTKTLREGAIAPWTTPAYVHELEELLDLAQDYGLPVDVPFSELRAEHLSLIRDGVPERGFGGLQGFYRWLERHKYKLSVRVFLSRWRSYAECPSCHGARLRSGALAYRLTSSSPRWPLPNITEVCQLNINDAVEFFNHFIAGLTIDERKLIRNIGDEVQARLAYLQQVGLGYLTLDRQTRTLSTGEAQRVTLTACLGSSLVNTLYVLDEPSAGLHARDNDRVIDAIQRLQRTGNTVIVVEHEESFVRAADHVVDIGPGAGREGGRVVFQGSADELLEAPDSITAAYMSGRVRLETPSPDRRRETDNGWLTVECACLHTLKHVTVRFPFGVLCVVTGVSGSGKSSLIEDTLYPALCRELQQSCSVSRKGSYDAILGSETIDEVVLVDQTAIGRTPRSNPVTYMKAFDEIRKTFANTSEAKLRKLTARDFSFNAAGGGRCPKCTGNGVIEIDMQFMANVSMTCPECQGTRFQREILEVKYRGMTIAEVLSMTVEEAFAFFRSQSRVQKRLQFLRNVGLGYLPLGQPATTLSGGESQRLKLASFLASSSKSHTLFLLNEPTIGLHAADVAKLLACFKDLLDAGQSLIVIEHNLDIIRSADYIVDLGPEAGDAGGEIVAVGTPEQIAANQNSITGRFLKGHVGS